MAKKEKAKEEIVVLSARYNRKSITCKWTKGDDAYAVTFHDNPLPSFEKALNALPEHVCSLCELPSKDAEKIEATGITIVPDGDDNEQALITAKKKIRKGKRVFNISTPLLSMYPSEAKDAKASDAMDEDQAKAITKFAAEVKKYILGERAQGKLSFEEEDGKKDAGEDGKTKTDEFPALTEAPEGRN